MPKKVKATVKLMIQAGQANPAPPVGPALGQHGVAIMDFCKAYNEATKNMQGQIIPAIITIYEDRSFDFVIKKSPVAQLLKKAAGIEKGSGVPHKEKVGTVTKTQVKEIAREKMEDLNTQDVEAASKIVAGTARSMGIGIEDEG